MLVEDDEANKVLFVLIDACGDFTKTLNLYCITHNSLPFLFHILYIWHPFIYMHICLYVRTMLLDIGIEFEISYMM